MDISRRVKSWLDVRVDSGSFRCRKIIGIRTDKHTMICNTAGDEGIYKTYGVFQNSRIFSSDSR